MREIGKRIAIVFCYLFVPFVFVLSPLYLIVIWGGLFIMGLVSFFRFVRSGGFAQLAAIVLSPSDRPLTTDFWEFTSTLIAATALLGCTIWITLALAFFAGRSPTPDWLNAIGLIGAISWGVFLVGSLVSGAISGSSGLWSDDADGGE